MAAMTAAAAAAAAIVKLFLPNVTFKKTVA